MAIRICASIFALNIGVLIRYAHLSPEFGLADYGVIVGILEDGDAAMELIKLAERVRVTILKLILRSLGLIDEASLRVETTEDGAIVLPRAGAYPIEIYSAEGIEEFESNNAVPKATLSGVHTLPQKK